MWAISPATLPVTMTRASRVRATRAGGSRSARRLRVALEQKLVGSDERVVLLVTGTGLKDIAAASRVVKRLRRFL